MAASLAGAASTEAVAPDGCMLEMTPRPSPPWPSVMARLPVNACALTGSAALGTYRVRAFRDAQDPGGDGTLRVAHLIRADQEEAGRPWVVVLNHYELDGC